MVPPPSLPSLKQQNNTDWKSIFQSLKLLPRFFGEIKSSSPRWFFINLTCRLVNAFTPIALLWVGKMILDEVVQVVQQPTKEFTFLWMLVATEAGIAIFSDLISRLDGFSDGILGDLYSNDSSVKLIKKAGDMNMSQLEDAQFYDKLERARTQTNGRVILISNVFAQGQDLVMMTGLILGLIYFEPWLIVLLVVSIVPSFLNEIKFSSSRYSLARSWTSERRELDYLRYIGANDKTAAEMKLFGLTDYIAERFRKLSAKYFEANKTIAVERAWLGGLFNIIGIGSYYGAYVLMVYRVGVGFITIGELTFLAASFNRLRITLQTTFARFTRISESALYLKDYFDYLDIPTDESITHTLPVPTQIRKGITFIDVGFSYPGAEKPVLENINFEIRAGEKMAFVGQNGAGKTTLIKLLLRFYAPTQGKILLDNVDIQHFDRKQYQKTFGVLFQDFLKYEFVVRENIGLGQVEHLENEAKIKDAAEKSLAQEVVDQLEGGYDQQLGKRFAKGKELSGGQWQKIALARAYMKDAQVMVLDEPTSALDARAEHEVFQRFIGLTKGKTSIIISHRFSTVRMADRILVLQNGTIHQIGTHDVLINQPGLYAELFELQAEGYH